jgi:hypothetical protein
MSYASKQLAEHFYNSMPKKSESDAKPSPAAEESSPPKIVKALDSAFIKSQEEMPADFPAAQSGSTGVACWVGFFLLFPPQKQRKMRCCAVGEQTHPDSVCSRSAL